MIRTGRLVAVALAKAEDGSPVLAVQINDEDGTFLAYLTSDDVVVELFKQLVPGTIRLSFLMSDENQDVSKALVTLGVLAPDAEGDVAPVS